MKKNILNILAAASAVALAMVPATVNAAGTQIQNSTGVLGANNCEVSIVGYEGTRPDVMIPKKITMNSVKEGDYEIKAFCPTDELDALDTNITVTPAASFTLTKEGTSTTVTATVTQDKNTFTPSEVRNGANGTVQYTNSETNEKYDRAVKQVTTKGHIVSNATSGSWKGTLVFTIS